jgi:hypothetical protein
MVIFLSCYDNVDEIGYFILDGGVNFNGNLPHPPLSKKDAHNFGCIYETKLKLFLRNKSKFVVQKKFGKNKNKNDKNKRRSA